MVFLDFRRVPGYILQLQWGSTVKARVCSATLGLLSRYEGYLRNLLKAWHGHTDAFRRGVRPPVQMRLGPRAFSWVSTGDSDIPSSGEMKGEPAFKPLQGNLAFFRVRASWCPFHLSLHTEGPSHITTAEVSLYLR